MLDYTVHFKPHQSQDADKTDRHKAKNFNDKIKQSALRPTRKDEHQAMIQQVSAGRGFDSRYQVQPCAS